MSKGQSIENITWKFNNPFVIFNLITLFVSIILILCLFIQPILSKIDLIADTITKIYWNGFFNEIDIFSGDQISSGYLTEFPFAGIWLNFSSVLLLLIISIIQLLVIFIKKGITRVKFLSFIIWPEFIYTVLTISGYLDVVNWKKSQIEEDILTSLRGQLIANLIIAIIVLLSILLLTLIITELNKEKINYIKNTN